MEEKIYIIGDVHGCFKTLIALINKLPKDSKICFVGDLVDRGSNSKDVIEFVKSNNYDCVLGNHEEMFIDNIQRLINSNKTDEDYSFWFNKCGGKETLESYGNDKDLLLEHINYLKTLPLYIEYENLRTEDNRYLVVSHSAVSRHWENRDKHKDSIDYKNFENSILYSRYKNYDNNEIFNVFGHTPYSEPQIKSFNCAIDLGCYYTDANSKGKLCALEFPSLNVVIQENIED